MKKLIVTILAVATITQSATISALFGFGERRESATPPATSTQPGFFERTKQRLGFGQREQLPISEPTGFRQGPSTFGSPSQPFVAPRAIGGTTTTRVGIELGAKPVPPGKIRLSESDRRDMQRTLQGWKAESMRLRQVVQDIDQKIFAKRRENPNHPLIGQWGSERNNAQKRYLEIEDQIKRFETMLKQGYRS